MLVKCFKYTIYNRDDFDLFKVLARVKLVVVAVNTEREFKFVFVS